MAETQRKAAKDKADQQLAQAKLAQSGQEHQMDNQTKIEIENAKITHQAILGHAGQQNDLQKHQMTQDTAMQQAAMQQQPPPGLPPMEQPPMGPPLQ
jgi:hypothetical protein